MSPQKHPESCACDDCDRRECLRNFMRARAFLARKGLLAEFDAWVDGAIQEGMPEVTR